MGVELNNFTCFCIFMLNFFVFVVDCFQLFQNRAKLYLHHKVLKYSSTSLISIA